MAQASSAQREPSMEEILASIRRIIEDSDTVRKGVQEDDLHDDAEGSTVESAVIEVNAFRSELHAGRNAPVDQSEPEAEPARPVTLADVQARIDAEAPGEQMSDQEDSSGQAAMEALAPRPSAEATGISDSQESDWPERPSIAPVATPEWNLQEESHAAAPHSEVVEPARASFGAEAQSQAAATPVQAEASGAVRPAIISEQAGRQVAAAFGELSEAFAARSRKTFDDMAEQMMRPMLQDWLDNNLPTLVERLVREEIERVARGG